jgi:aminomethyltransferase
MTAASADSQHTHANSQNDALKRTPLHELHLALGAKMAPFAGYDMPIQYPTGILKEHNHTRSAAGLFDVSHMGMGELNGPKGMISAFERLIPGDIAALKPGRIRYSLLLNQEGGIIDDLMITRKRSAPGAERLYVVVNAACKDNDFPHVANGLAGAGELTVFEDSALLALQGPQAAMVLSRLAPGVEGLAFMTAAEFAWRGVALWVSRSGYTGEDGYEIQVPASAAADFAKALLAEPETAPIGLGARDSLRLEAGLCLYGHDIDQTTSPVEADLVWAIGKRRREEGGFPGSQRIMKELAEGPSRLRVAIKPETRAIARDGCEILDASGARIGLVTSGAFGPTVGGPIAMGYVTTPVVVGALVKLVVRGVPHPARIIQAPFTPHRYRRAA